jgi:WD40 repeat protein
MPSLWRVSSLKNTLTLKHPYTVENVHAQGAFIATACQDDIARVFDFEGNILHELTGHTNKVRSIRICKDKLITTSYDHSIKIWNLEDGRNIRTKNFETTIDAIGVEQDKIFILGGLNYPKYNRVTVLDMDGAKLDVLKIGEGLTPTGLSFFKNHVYFGDHKKIHIYNLETLSAEDTIKLDNSISGDLFVSDKHIVYVSDSKKIRVLDRESQSELFTINDCNPISSPSLRDTFVYDGKIVVRYKDREIRIYDINSGELLHTLTGHKETIASLCVIDKKIYSASYRGDEKFSTAEVKVWSA